MKRARINGEGDNNGDDIVKINAGGKLYYTTQKTLTSNFPSSMITRLFTRKEMIPLDDQGNYFIDVDPTLFGALLNVMRRPNLVEVVPAGINEETWWLELDYWGIRDYVVMVEMEEDKPLASLVLKQQLLKEKEVAMTKQMKRVAHFVVDCILLWGGFDEILTFVMPITRSSTYIKSGVVYVDLVNATLSKKDLGSAKCMCVSAYVWRFRDQFIALLKEWTGFEEVTIITQRPKDVYLFEGQRYPASTKEEVYIEMTRNYHNNIM